MLNYLWGFMILAGILWGAANNSLDAVTQGLLDSAGEAVKLCITMAGVMSFWCGILEVGNRSGLIEWLADKMEPILTFLFPDLGKDHPARLPISVNMAANMLGLGMAASRLRGNEINAGRETVKGNQRHVYLSDHQHFFPAASSCYYDRLPQPIWFF